jgi:DNA-binding transcriptional LysR family regulator
MSDASQRRWAVKLAALDVNLLVALDALLQEANVTRAAARIGITQSAMSQTLGRLREYFEDPILVRAGRGMQPTLFAERLRSRLHTAIGELEAVVRERPQFVPGKASRRFVIATVDYLALLFVPSLQRLLQERAPGIDLAVCALDVESVNTQLETGVVDLYLGVPGKTEAAMQTTPLFQEAFSVVMRPKHPLRRAGLSVEAYAQAQHLHVSPRRHTTSIVARALSELGLERRVALEVPFFALVPSVLHETDLIATVPTRLAQWFEAEHGLALSAPPLLLSGFEICMAWHPRFDREQGLVWLRERVAEVTQGA